jgi:hypothetical protein
MNLHHELDQEIIIADSQENSGETEETEKEDKKTNNYGYEKNMILCGKKLSHKKVKKVMSSKPRVTRTILANFLCIMICLIIILLITGL